MLTAVQLPDQPETIRVFLKGAPELVLTKCKKTIATNGNVQRLDDDEMNYILHDITTERFAKEGFRTLALAYKDLSRNDFNRLSS
jgi:magnesium-transporting ATPase (P-type)